MLHAANALHATEVSVWKKDASGIWWPRPGDRCVPLAVAHYDKGGPDFDDAVSKLGSLPVCLMIRLSTDLTAQLRHEVEGLEVILEAVGGEDILALLHPCVGGVYTFGFGVHPSHLPMHCRAPWCGGQLATIVGQSSWHQLHTTNTIYPVALALYSVLHPWTLHLGQ